MSPTSHRHKPDPIAAELDHVVDVGSQHDHGAMLAQRNLGDRRIDLRCLGGRR
jgi:hypothetical protein